MATPANNWNGTITYGYDNNSVLTSKLDARGIKIVYAPDQLHRIWMKSYQNDPLGDQTTYYCYDNNQANCGTQSVNNAAGRRSGMKDASGVTYWSYDPVGRLEWKNETIAGYNHSIVYRHNLDGSYNNVTYPDGTVATYTYNNAGRPIAVQDTAGDDLASGSHYAAPGELTSVVLGNYGVLVV